MDAVRKIDEGSAPILDDAAASSAPMPEPRKILVIDDSAMLLNFVNEILAEANYQVATAATAEEGIRAATTERPHLILLDYVLPDMQGDEVLRRLASAGETATIPVVYMSGFGADLKSDPKQNPNVIGSLNKPFTSELLLTTVKTNMPTETSTPEPAPTPLGAESEAIWAPVESLDPPAPSSFENEPAAESNATEVVTIEAAAGGSNDAWWTAAPAPPGGEELTAPPQVPAYFEPPPQFAEQPAPQNDQFTNPPIAAADEIPMPTGGAYFCGDTSFFSLNWALHTIGNQKLTGTLRCFWKSEAVEVISRDGAIVLATTHDPELYCTEAPITLASVDQERITAARERQRETGRPLFVTLAEESLIIREPSIQLVQHYGQKLFAQLWTASRVRFMFEQSDQVPEFARDLPGEEDIDHWALGTLRVIQFHELGSQANFDQASIPAYTRDGFTRVQKLRLTVAEAQFASQFNGTRSVAQIAKNLRLDLKFARLSLFRFVALEIIECWPPVLGAKQEKRGVFGRMFGG